MTHECFLTCESSPKVISIVKKRIAHKGGMGIRVTAAGYTTKAKPDPEDTTSSIPTPNSFAMKPKMLKITKPANTEVEQLLIPITNASLLRNMITL